MSGDPDFENVPDDVVKGLTKPPPQPTRAQEREAERLSAKAEKEVRRRGL